jgi:hypothetical protein
MHVLLTIDAMCGRRVRQGNAGQIDEAVMSACLCEGTAMMLVLLLCSLREDLSSSKGQENRCNDAASTKSCHSGYMGRRPAIAMSGYV